VSVELVVFPLPLQKVKNIEQQGKEGGNEDMNGVVK
jgi:hypothetical protein